MYSTSGGKALLAELDEPELHEMFPDERGYGHFANRAELFDEIEEIRRLGYARNRGESEAGIAAVGLVQRSSSGRIVGALAVSAPETRMTEERTGEVVAALRRVSAEAQRRLP